METPFRVNSVTCLASPGLLRTEWPLVTRLSSLPQYPEFYRAPRERGDKSRQQQRVLEPDKGRVG